MHIVQDQLRSRGEVIEFLALCLLMKKSLIKTSRKSQTTCRRVLIRDLEAEAFP